MTHNHASSYTTQREGRPMMNKGNRPCQQHSTLTQQQTITGNNSKTKTKMLKCAVQHPLIIMLLTQTTPGLALSIKNALGVAILKLYPQPGRSNFIKEK
jgi:hypothetical protein